MSAVLEQPKPEIFEAVNYFDKRVVGSNVKRWVWFPGDLIIPERKAEISWLAVGGEETTSPCLQRYGRGFVPRGRAALLELGGEPIPMRHLGDLQAVAWQGIPLNENAVKNNFGFVPVYPGDGLRVLRRYSMNDGGVRKGLDEDTALLGKEWEECHDDAGDGILDVIEGVMFADGMEPTLKGLEDQIRYVNVADSRIDLGKLKSDRLRMCEEFRNWATRKVTYEHGLLKSGTIAIATDAVGSVGGWSYSYSPITEMLLQQLGIPRQDQPLQEMARMVAQVSNQPTTVSAIDMEIFERKMDERLARAREADAQRIAELEARLAGKSDDAPKTYVCEHCNEEVKLAGKGIHIGVHCPSLHPKTTDE
jgi:hypothetical protein